jgi:pimeloyl-ACP methyl ester carboxylesterase
MHPIKTRLLHVLLGFFCLVRAFAAEPVAKQPMLVSVHGAWAGGWQMKKVAPLLEAKGWKVYRPSLSGLGEHFNTASPDIGLATHIDDIVNFILFEDLHDVILLGHSYGGMIITGVADRIPERLSRLVYLDAFLPVDGESVLTMRKPGTLDIESMKKDGFIIPSWVKPDKPFPKDVPHPLKTFSDPIVLKNPAAAKVPITYILTVDPGKKPEDDDFYPSAERAKARGWPVIIMEADHVPQWRKPEATAELLLGLLQPAGK